MKLLILFLLKLYARINIFKYFGVLEMEEGRARLQLPSGQLPPMKFPQDN